jgi:hypothetical protein
MAGLSCYLVLGSATPAAAMHISEGFLPVQWAVFCGIVALPFFVGRAIVKSCENSIPAGGILFH